MPHYTPLVPSKLLESLAASVLHNVGQSKRRRRLHPVAPWRRAMSPASSLLAPRFFRQAIVQKLGNPLASAQRWRRYADFERITHLSVQEFVQSARVQMMHSFIAASARASHDSAQGQIETVEPSAGDRQRHHHAPQSENLC
jgi:hypothetical protein